ncbi:hypothetical protein JW978_02535 [Candidatus Dojkabacteria bacterium]|nr:hypothetical protein [Candidatus Dojkabacteria bacterium]
MTLSEQTSRGNYIYNTREPFYQDRRVYPVEPTPERDWWAEVNKLIFTLETTRSQFFTTLTIQVFANRVTLTYKPFIGAGETTQTYNAADIGNVYTAKSRKYATVGVCMKNKSAPLFEVKRLKHQEAERLKEALEKMIAFNYLMFRP